MKKTIFMTAVCVMLLSSCGTPKNAASTGIETTRTRTTNLEGEKVIVETTALTGIEMVEVLNEDGTDIIKRPYKWFAGIGTTDNKQMSIELAQREAYATISRVLNNAVLDKADRSNIANNGNVQQALTSHWEQLSASIQKGCEPFGTTTIQYNPKSKMYEATAKVGIRGDRYKRMIEEAGNFKPENLSGDELEQFISINKEIMEAAKGNDF